MVVRHSHLRLDSPFAAENSAAAVPVPMDEDAPRRLPVDQLPVEIESSDPIDRQEDEDDDEEDDLSRAERDEVSAALGLLELGAAEVDFRAALRSGWVDGESEGLPVDGRVKVDAWHLMDRIKTPKRHGALQAFMRAFSDVLFVPRAHERALYTARLEREGKTYDEERKYNSAKMWERVSRDIEARETVFPNLAECFRIYGPIKDAKTGAPLFNDDCWKVAKGVLASVAAGHVSDVSGVALYYPIAICGGKCGTLRDGVMVYHCSRSTCGAEGGVHKPIKDVFPKGGVSVRHANARLKDFTLRHNLKVGTRNTTGARYDGHFDIWEINTLQRLQEETRDQFPSEPPLEGWTNGTLYAPTAESFGILPIPAAVVAELDLPSHSTSTDQVASGSIGSKGSNDPFCPSTILRHDFLARAQGTRFAVMHVHTADERILFGELSKDRSVTEASASRRWMTMAKLWVEKADGKTVFFKLPEHLEAYSKKREKRLNEKLTLEAGPAARQVFDTSMHTKTRKADLPVATFNAPLVPPPIVRGRLPSSQVPSLPISHPRIAPLPRRALNVDPSRGSDAAATTPRPAAPRLGGSSEPRSADQTPEPTEVKKRTRSCAFCGANGEQPCPGKAGVAKCKGVCVGCGRLYGDDGGMCLGRVKRYPGQRKPKCANEVV